jgi:hypothetical protein
MSGPDPYPVGGPDQRSVIGWFAQGDDLVAVAYLGPAPLSQVRQWAADAVDKLEAIHWSVSP